MDDEAYIYAQYFLDESEDDDSKEWIGKGNAKKGYKNEYNLFDTSPVYFRLRDRQRVWDAFSILSPSQFIDLCDECLPLWELPRSPDANEPRARTHGIEACLFTTLGILKTGHSDLEMEAVAEMSHGLINIEFKRMLGILDKILEPEMALLKDWEKGKCIAAAKSSPGILYYLDGCDFAVRVGEHKYLYKTHKKNVKHQRAIRAQILVDSQYVI